MAPWNDTKDRQLLLAIIQATNPTPNWEEIAPLLNKTKEAVRQRFAKLKKETAVAAPGEGATKASTKKTNGKTTATSKNDNTDDEANNDDEDDGDDDNEGEDADVPTNVKPAPRGRKRGIAQSAAVKRPRKTAAPKGKKAAAAAAEDDEEDEDEGERKVFGRRGGARGAKGGVVVKDEVVDEDEAQGGEEV